MGSQLAKKTVEDYLAEGHTPMMAQYHMTKSDYPDCLLFYRMGDFYELFFEDAIIAASVLDITLTKRGKSNGDDIPMCGVPYHASETYLARLIKAGHKVAICEQTESPEQAKKRAKEEGKPASKALVKREVVRVITQGTLTEDNLLDARDNNYLASLVNIGGQLGLSWLELSTGEFRVQPLMPNEVAAVIERINPREIVIPSNICENQKIKTQLLHYSEKITEQPASLFNYQNAQKRMESIFGVGTLDAFGGFSRAEIAAAGAVIDYTERTQVGKLPHLGRPEQISHGSILEIDAATRRNLELIRTMSGEKKGALLDCIDRTVTAAGARLLQSRLSSPLTDKASIDLRLNEVSFFKDNQRVCESLRDILKKTPDMERALARLTVSRGGPKDLGAIRDGLNNLTDISELLNKEKKLSHITADLEIDAQTQSLYQTLKDALLEELPLMDKEGGFIAPNYHPPLDKLRLLRDDARRLIASLQQKYKDFTSIESLKISYNNVLGYFIEVPAKKADALIVRKDQPQPSDNPFIHRQTMANAVRFTTAELAELERDILQAGDRALSIEQELFEKMVEMVALVSASIGRSARALAALDVSSSLAVLAIDNHYSHPKVDDSLNFNIKSGRHPVVENALSRQTGEKFVPNDCSLSNDASLWLLTGPNMAGKSTFLRQNAIIAIMAQIGSYVPAEEAHIGIVDRLFSRVGASDDLASGRSTFMVEMVETAAILNQASSRSLVILDEIGRGTATFDGLSIAWATLEHLHEVNQCRAIFATHYHELTSLQGNLDKLSCHSMEVKEWEGDIIFLHNVITGSADHSYGIHVAKLAGLPIAVIERAKAVLEQLQKSESSGKLASLTDDLPLFSAEITDTQSASQSELEIRLNNISPDELSPKEALDVLYELKQLNDTH